MRVLSVLSLVCLSIGVGACVGTQSAAPVTKYGTSAGPGSAGVHVVVSGDTLYSISQRYDIVMRDIAYANHLAPPFILETGRRLVLPPPREYRVRAGDSLYTVSRLFDASSSEIASLNDLRAPYTIHPGDILRLPSATSDGGVVVARADTSGVERVTRPYQSSSDGRVSQSGERGNAAVVPPKKPVQSVKVKQASKKIAAQTPKRSSSKFLTPVNGRVISTYGPKSDGLHNDGINIAAARGTPVKAAENGVVVYAGNGLKGSGNLILVRHEDRWMTAYGHLDQISIKSGDVIKRGTVIGKVGSTGGVRDPQLHFEVRRGTKALNPKPYLEG